jgi:hypothetical protein
MFSKSQNSAMLVTSGVAGIGVGAAGVRPIMTICERYQHGRAR